MIGNVCIGRDWKECCFIYGSLKMRTRTWLRILRQFILIGMISKHIHKLVYAGPISGEISMLKKYKVENQITISFAIMVNVLFCHVQHNIGKKKNWP